MSRESKTICLRNVYFGLLVVVLIILPIVAYGKKPYPILTEDYIVSLLKNTTMKPLGKASKRCNRFLEDSKTFRGMKVIAPDFTGDIFTNKKYGKLIKQCPKLEVNKNYQAYKRNIKLRPEDYKDAADAILLGLDSHTIYQVDINNEAGDGKEYVYYYENEKELITGIVSPARRYSLVDFQNCKKELLVYVNAGGKKARSGVVKYKNNYGIVYVTHIGNSIRYVFISLDHKLHRQYCMFKN